MDRKTNEDIALPSLVETPAYDGGFSYLTHVIAYESTYSGDFIIVKPAFIQFFLPYVYSFLGVALMFYMWVIGGSFWITLFGVSILFFASAVSFLTTTKLNIFMDSGVIFHEKDRITHYINIGTYELDQVHSLQVINKLISRGQGITPYRSYELNLVFKSGERINLLHDGKLERIKKTAEKLGSALKIPYNYLEKEQVL